jgi:hypothetical protein
MSKEQEMSIQQTNKHEAQQIDAVNETPLREGEDEYLPSFQNLQNFVKEAVQNNIHLRIPQHRYRTDEQWATGINMLGIYVFTHDGVSLEDIGEKYGRSRERVRQIIKDTTEKMYAIAPQTLREKYTFESFSFAKPKAKEIAFKSSAARGGKLREVAALTQEGKTAQEIGQALGLSYRQVSKLRYDQPELQIPYIQPRPVPIEDELADPATTVQKRQALLDQISSTRRDFSKIHVVKLSTLTKEASLSMYGKGDKVRRVANVLRKHGVPIAIIENEVKGHPQRYGIIAEVDQERILEILKTDLSLDDLRKKR